MDESQQGPLSPYEESSQPEGTAPQTGSPQPQKQPQSDFTPGQYYSMPQFGDPPPRAPQPPYQPPAPAYAVPAVPPAPQKQRRVGTFTLGLSLILLGVMIPYGLMAGTNAWDWLRFAPLVLVFLGVETLVYAFRFRSEKLRYDGLSVFMVIMITLGALGASMVVRPIANAVSYSQEVSQNRHDLEKKAEQVMAGLGYQGYAYSYVSGDYQWYWLWHGELQDDWDSMTLQLNLSQLDTENPTRDQVEDAFLKLAQQLLTQDRVERVRFETNTAVTDEGGEGRITYSVELYKGEAPNLNKSLIQKRMSYSIDRFADNGYENQEYGD